MLTRCEQTMRSQWACPGCVAGCLGDGRPSFSLPERETALKEGVAGGEGGNMEAVTTQGQQAKSAVSAVVAAPKCLISSWSSAAM